jgi:DNA helicase IV
VPSGLNLLFAGIVLAISIFAASAGVVLLVFELRLSKSVRSVSDELKRIEAGVSEYQGYTKYMPKRERVSYAERLNSLLGPIRFLQANRRLLDARQRTLTDKYNSKARDLSAFLDKFVPEYVKREVERHRTFFGSRSFDRDQIEAIIKKDSFNLVIAGAGSGKTRTLTGRYAFLVESGVSPDEILALAYTKSAAKEMEARLRNDYGIRGADVRTFHSFGRELSKLSPDFRNGVASRSVQGRLIAESFQRLSSERPGFASKLLDFAVEWRTREAGPEIVRDKEKYYEFLRNQRYTTLDSRQVKSIAERDIANFLILNRVKFEYEAAALWADSSSEFRQYEPDFYLPEYDIWIEHFGIDREGEVPAWFTARGTANPTETYRAGMRWKRGQFEKHHKKLIQTYYYQWVEGSLGDELKRQLQENGVVLHELTKAEVLDYVNKLIPQKDYLQKLMFQFVIQAKMNALTMSGIESKSTTGGWSRKQRAFANLMISIWQEYEVLLKEENKIDFSDMINYALQVVKQDSGRRVRRYSHILVDEFQDITNPQLELLRSLLSGNPTGTLFCVGDDRQNIFSFAGADINSILEFEKRFPYAERTTLSTNYRCPKNIVEVSNVVANLNNPKRTRTASAREVDHPMSLIEGLGNYKYLSSFEEWEFQKAKELLARLIRSKGRDEQILVLARTNHSLNRLKVEFPSSDGVGLKFLTIHRAKGLEADYVLLLGCVSGPYGFPSEVFDDKMLDIVKRKQETKGERIEEERRLFYVALTRCKSELFVFSSKSSKSQFVQEIEPYLTNRKKPELPAAH